jgi:hypothetical protein
VKAALAETGMLMVGSNTRQSANGPADFGVNSLPGRVRRKRVA